MINAGQNPTKNHSPKNTTAKNVIAAFYARLKSWQARYSPRVKISLFLAIFCPLAITATLFVQFGSPVFGQTFCFPVDGCTGTSTNPTTNSILIGNSNGVYDVKTLTAGSNITISNSGSTVTINSSGGGSFPFTPTSYGNSTSSIIGFLAGLTSIGSTTITGSSTITGVLTAPGGIYGNLTGTASLATALAADPSDCLAGNFPLGINAAGTAQNCTDAWTEAENTAAAYISLASLSGVWPISYNSGSGAISFVGLSTSSPIAAGAAVVYATGVRTIASVATSTPTVSAPLQYSGSLGNFVGGSSGAFSITQAGAGTNGYLSSTDWNLFNNKISSSSLSATFPLAYNSATGAFTFGGLTTSTPAVQSNIPYFSGVNTFANVATTSPTFSGPFTTSGLGALVGGSSPTINWTGLSTTSQPASSNLLVSNGAAGVFAVATGSVSGSGLVAVTAGRSAVGGALAISLSNINANTLVGNPTGASAAPTSLPTSTLWGASTPGYVLAYGDSIWKPMATATCVQITGASSLCDGDDATGAGGSFPFTPATHFGTTTNATTTPLWLQGNLYSLMASGTAVFFKASTSQITIGTDFITDLDSSFSITAAGVVSTSLGTSISASEIADGDHGDFTYTGGSAAIDANSIALTTDTTGNYVESITGTANQITVTNGSGAEDLDSTLSLPSHVIFPGNFQATNATTTNATTTSFYITGQAAAASTNCLQIDTGGQITKTGSACGAGGGNMSGWATTTSQQPGTLLLYPVNSTSTDVTFGNNSSTTAPFWWDVSASSTYIGNGGVGTSSLALSGSSLTASNKFWNLGSYSSAQLGNGDFIIASSSNANDLVTNVFFSISQTGVVKTPNASSTQLSGLTAYLGNLATSTFTSLGRVGLASSSPSLLWGISLGTTTVGTGVQVAISYASSTSQAASYTVNWDTGNNQRFFLNQATNLIINATSSNPRDGGKYTLKICQDGTGSRTATFVTPGQLVWSGGNGATTTVASAANAVTIIGMIYDARAQRYDVVASTTKSDARSCIP